MQHQARCLDASAVPTADVDSLTDQGVTRLREVDSDLMRAAGFQPAFDQGDARATRQDRDVGDRRLAQLRVVRRAAQAIATVFDQARPERAPFEIAVDQCQVAPVHAVKTELLLEMSFGRHAAREHDQPAGLFVQSMHHAERRLRARVAPAELPAHQVDERALLAGFEGHGAEQRRLVHHHHVSVRKDYLASDAWRRAGSRRREPELDALSGRDDSARIGDWKLVDPDLAGLDGPADSGPSAARRCVAERPIESRAVGVIGDHEVDVPERRLGHGSSGSCPNKDAASFLL